MGYHKNNWKTILNSKIDLKSKNSTAKKFRNTHLEIITHIKTNTINSIKLMITLQTMVLTILKYIKWHVH